MKTIATISPTTARPMPSLCHNDIDQLYDTTHVCCPGYHTLSFGTISILADLFRKAFRAIFQRHQHETILHDLSVEEYTILDDAITSVAGSHHIDMVDYRNPQARTLQRLRTNLVTFVAFKNYQRSQDIIRALTDDTGKIRSWAAFQREVITLGEKYNVHWLEAEYNTVIAAAQSAAQWDDYVRDADIFPYLVYKTQHDDKVRVSHQLLHDVCKPIIDTFWDTYYPPNGWRCRCYVLQARTDQGYKKEPDAYPDDKSIPPVFRHNPAKSGKVWNHKHPYFLDVDAEIKDKIMITRNQLMKADTMYDTIDDVQVHYSNYFSTSFDSELSMAKTLKSVYNHSVKMLSQFDDPHVTTPDYLIDDHIIAEYKEYSSLSIKHIEQKIRDKKDGAITQLANSRYSHLNKVIIINIDQNIEADRLLGKLKKSGRIQQLGIKLWIYQNGNLSMH